MLGCKIFDIFQGSGELNFMFYVPSQMSQSSVTKKNFIDSKQPMIMMPKTTTKVTSTINKDSQNNQTKQLKKISFKSIPKMQKPRKPKHGSGIQKTSLQRKLEVSEVPCQRRFKKEQPPKSFIPSPSILGGGPVSNKTSLSQVPLAGTKVGLRLSNTRPGGIVANLCFINADLNVLNAVDEFRNFFKQRLFEISNQKAQVCDIISELFNQEQGEVGDAHKLRNLVAICSGMDHLEDGSQKDLIEFQHALFWCLRSEFNKVTIQISF